MVRGPSRSFTKEWTVDWANEWPDFFPLDEKGEKMEPNGWGGGCNRNK